MRLAATIAVSIMTMWLMGCISNQNKNVETSQSTENEMQVLSMYGYIGLPEGNKIIPRYSRLDDVFRSIGGPTEMQYYEDGTENFTWDNFWTYRYGNRDLNVDYENQSERIIRIITKIPGLMGSTFPFGLDSDPRKNRVLGSIIACPEVSRLTLLDNGALFELGEVKGLQGFIYWDSNNVVNLYGWFYLDPWEGYVEQ